MTKSFALPKTNVQFCTVAAWTYITRIGFFDKEKGRSLVSVKVTGGNCMPKVST